MASVELTDTDRELVERVTGHYREAETEHRQFREHAGEFYALYRGFQDFRDQVSKATPRGRDDEFIREAKDTYGAELFIPYAFSTVETIVPRMVAHRPRMLVLPRDRQALGNVDNMRIIMDAQQAQINYELILQDVAKDGLLYGLGVQKTGWRKTYKRQRGVQPGQYGGLVELPSTGPDGSPLSECSFDDPYAERVDPWDWIWDPYGDSIDTIEWCIHRTWRSDRYVRRMVAEGHWRQEFDLDALLAGGPSSKRDEIWEPRHRAENLSNLNRGDRLHEVWEFHDREQVVTILDSQTPVQVGENPAAHGDLPFQVYRPTKVAGRMVGIGEIEPIKHLQYEINTLRSQRRYAATFALMQAYAYDESVIDPDDLKIGPGTAIPVNGNPKDFLLPLELKDVPGSGYKEEQAIQGDLDRTSGISDTVTGAQGDGGAAETATGVQLVQAAAGQRIANKTRRLEVEVIVPAGRQWLALNQHKILEPRDVPVPLDGKRAWTFRQVTPNELRGRMAVAIEGGTAPENVPQKRQDAQMFLALAGNQFVRPELAMERALELMDVEDPQGWVVPPEPTIPADMVEAFLQEVGVPPEALLGFIAQQQALEAGESGDAQDAPSEAVNPSG